MTGIYIAFTADRVWNRSKGGMCCLNNCCKEAMIQSRILYQKENHKQNQSHRN